MSDAHLLITENIDVWTTAIKKRSATGRGSNKKIELTGIKKLRELILELAVRGKLVPQDPNDEPASVLLEKIVAEKAQLIKDKKIKKPKVLPEIGEDKKPFILPSGWEWDYLSDLCILENGDRSKNYPNKSLLVESGIPFVNAGHLQGGRVDKNAMTFITSERFELLRSGKFINGDILYCLRGSLGKAALVEDFHNGAIASSLIIIRFFKMISSKLMLNYFASPLASAMIRTYDNGTAQPNLSAADLGKFLVPIAPLAEQCRIVEKVDELMGLCDQLEHQTEDSITAHKTLVESLLATLSNSETPAEFNQNWARIAEHFDTLFTTEHSIDQLKQTVLQLAVMGKLVPQNPNDEPASELLEKIAAEKEQLIKDKKIKKQKPLPAITEDEKPFELPRSWEFCRLADLIPQFQNGASSRGDSNGKEIVVLRLADIKDWQVSMSDTRSISINEKSIERYLLQQGDVLIIRVNGSADIVGRFITCHENYSAIYCDHFIRMRFPIECFSAAYLSLLGSSALIRERINDLFVSTAGQKTVNQTHIGSLNVTLPPLAEQHRIVKKADELMTLCNQLKTRLNDTQTTQLHLAETIVEQSIN